MFLNVSLGFVTVVIMPSKSQISRTSINVGICPIKRGETCILNSIFVNEMTFQKSIFTLKCLYMLIIVKKKKKKAPLHPHFF